MKLSLPLILSVGLNLALASSLALRWTRSGHVVPPRPGPVPGPTPVRQAEFSKPAFNPQHPQPITFSWRLIESDDYHIYLANLRKFECPEYLVREIIVADLDDLYASRARTATKPVQPPWQGADHRRAAERDRLAAQFKLQAEKRALVRELLGYPWDNHVNEAWHEEYKLAMVLGFLPDDRAAQTLALAHQYEAAAETVRDAAHEFLTPEDRSQLRELYQELQSDVAGLLSPAELEELQLRVQAVGFFPAHLHLEGLVIEGLELHELARLTRVIQDAAQTAFTGPEPQTELERAARTQNFESQLLGLLGRARFEEYQRAQDDRYRESYEFALRNQLPESAATAVYQSRLAAEAQAALLKADHSLSPSQQAYAIETLRTSTAEQLAGVLGRGFQNYLAGPGVWLDSLDTPATDAPGGASP